MDEQEFLRRNKELKARQAAARAERERELPIKIGADNFSTLAAKIPIPKCYYCGSTESLVETTGYAVSCRTCEEKHQKHRQEESVRQRRRDRQQKVEEFRFAISQVIPPAYGPARLRQFNKPFTDTLLSGLRAPGLVLFGPTGTGKTYAACALLRYCITKQQHCKRIGYETLCLEIRDTFKQGSEYSEEDILKRYLGQDVLVVEDVGAIKPIGVQESDFALRVIYVLLDTRIEQNRITIITTNKNLANLRTGFDERIASRLSLFKWIGVGGKDKRAPSA